jgi:hypothetical protein
VVAEFVDPVLEGARHRLEQLLEGAVEVVELVGHALDTRGAAAVVFLPPGDARLDPGDVGLAVRQLGPQDGAGGLIHRPGNPFA